MSPPRDRAVEVAVGLARLARPIVLRHFRQQVAVEDKADLSPVTVADRDAELAMRKAVADAFPDHGFRGEEFPPDRPDAELVWVVDPIDGTKSFITGRPLFGTLIALVEAGRPVVGVIDLPALDEVWLGADDRSTTLNGRAMRCRPCAELGRAMLYSTSPLMFRGPDAHAFERVAARVKHPLFGGDCAAYTQVAGGWADLVIEASLKTFDYCALVPVVEGAGGRMTDWQGRPLGLESDGRVIAAGDPRLVEQALECLAG